MRETFTWLSGFIAAIEGVPTEKQWTILKEKVAAANSSVPVADVSGGVRVKDVVPGFQPPPSAALSEEEWRRQFRMALTNLGCDADNTAFLVGRAAYDPNTDPAEEARLSYDGAG